MPARDTQTTQHFRSILPLSSKIVEGAVNKVSDIFGDDLREREDEHTNLPKIKDDNPKV